MFLNRSSIVFDFHIYKVNWTIRNIERKHYITNLVSEILAPKHDIQFGKACGEKKSKLGVGLL